jgi:dTDP-4-dehydrorhamnose 3,5-epimerase
LLFLLLTAKYLPYFLYLILFSSVFKCGCPGYAHGFQALTPDCELLYLHAEAYHPEAEGGLQVIDHRININWALPISELSPRDHSHPFISPNFQGIVL